MPNIKKLTPGNVFASFQPLQALPDDIGFHSNYAALIKYTRSIPGLLLN
jgi:hypothetical protein